MMTRPRGITMVEVLTAVGILALLVAIALPAVLSSRATAQRLHCTNQLRQLSLGLNAYLAQFTVFPQAAAGRRDECLPEGDSVFTTLFPYIELPAACALFQQSQLRVPLLVCPADGDTAIMSAPLSYTANDSPGSHSGYLGNGPFSSYVNERVIREGDVIDGMSHSTAFSEHVIPRRDGDESTATANPPRYHWVVVVDPLSAAAQANPNSPAALLERQTQTELSLIDCRGHFRTFQPITQIDGYDWRFASRKGIV
jgi:hypothetical protein